MMYLLLTLIARPYLVFAPIKKKFYLEISSLPKSSSPDYGNFTLPFRMFTIFITYFFFHWFFSVGLIHFLCQWYVGITMCRVPEGRLLVFATVVSCLPRTDRQYTWFWLSQNCYCLIIIWNQIRIRQFY